MILQENIIGCRCFISGDLQNGAFVTHDEVVRVVTRVTEKHIICECGRRFIINDNLKIKKFNF